MRRRPSIRHLLMMGALTVAWCGLWRSISFANVVSGLVVSAAVTISGVGTSGRGGIRVVPLAKFAWLVLLDLMRSTLDVAVEILAPTDRTAEAVIAVDLPAESRQHLLLLVVAITLTPGTAVIGVDSDSAKLYLHLLQVDRQPETVAHVTELAELACAALSTRTAGVT